MKKLNVLLVTVMTIGLMSCMDFLGGDNNGGDNADLTYSLVVFGQTIFYDEDGTYLKGASTNYTDNGDSIVTDANTGLTGQSIPSSNKFSWQEAVDYCENLVLAGYFDWRLPNVKELQSIVCYDYAPGASDAANEGPAI